MAEVKKNLAERLMGVGRLESELVSKSRFFKPKEVAQISVPIFNVANTGELGGGLASGVTVIAGPSRHFKTTLALVHIKAYMDKHPDAICVFYDSEFGVALANLIAAGVPQERILHVPILNIEELKQDMVAKLNDIKFGEHVVFLCDSIGNLASANEVKNAEEGNEALDMTRAKAIKGLFRIITPHFTIKDIPAIFIAHVYDEQKMYGKTIVSGGTGIMLSANNVWIIGRSQEKDGDEVIGYKFRIRIEKSRFIKERSEFEFIVTFDGGINRWSGLLELAIESGFVIKGRIGKSLGFQRVNKSTGEIEEKKFTEAETNNIAFWKPILLNVDFAEFIKKKFQLGTASLVQDESSLDAE